MTMRDEARRGSAGLPNAGDDGPPPDRSGEFATLEREAYDWVMRFKTGEAGSADLAALRRWSQSSPAHLAAYDRISRAWIGLGAVAQDLAGGNSAVRFPRTAPVSRRALIGGALAASAAGAALALHPPLGFWPSWPEFAADFRTAIGEQRHVAIDDVGIEMNTRTSIALRPSAGATRRIELIAGEAAMSIPREGVLMVEAGDGRVVATRARFNIRHDNRQVRVTCLDGDLRVECGGDARVLEPGRQVLYTDRGFGQAVAVDASAVTAWQGGLVIFRSTPISEVVEEINRYRPGRVILTNRDLGRRQLNARFRIAEIDQVVGQIEQIFGARATALPGGILLLG
uniref:Putative FecR n=1 Tax=Rhodopseudomonas palustris (strain BisA53) TaxID=316055 RepID=Q07LL1_RHOP5